MLKWSVVILGIVFLAVSCYISAYHHPWLTLKTCLENPEVFDGELVNNFREASIGTLYADGFELKQRHGPSIRVLADTTGLITGKYIGLEAIFSRTGYLTAVKMHMSPNRRVKIWISLIPAGLIISIFIRSFRWNLKKIQFEKRKYA